MALDNKKLALIKNRLQMPLIVRDLLTSGKMPSDEEIYALHDLLCTFSTEDTLLCSAFTMKEIASFGNVHPSDMPFLHMECERLIERYAAQDDLATENPELWETSQINMLDETAEDLECFLDLLALCKLSHETIVPCVGSILEILDAQLQSQLIIIDEVIAMHCAQQEQAINETPNTNTAQYLSYGDNIIPFPA